MAKSTTTGNLFAKLGNQLSVAHEQHKGDETDYGSGGELPAGIELGVAKLTECKFDVYKTGDNKGKYFFYAAGIVVGPKTFVLEDGREVKVEGLRTSIMEALCDTPKSKSRKTIADHYGWILNELRKLGVDTTNIDAKDLETVATTIAGQGIYFGFRTWAGKPTPEYPKPRTTHTWTGAVEYAEAEAEDDVEDATAEVIDETPTTPVKTTEKPVAAKPGKAAPKPATKPPVASKPSPKPEPVVYETDLNALAETADAGNQKAIFAITDAALKAGYTEEQIETEFPSWVALAEALTATEISADGEESAEGEEADLVALGEAADAESEEAITLLSAMAEEAGLDHTDGETYPTWTALASALAGGAEEEVAEADWAPMVKEIYKYTPAGKTKPSDCEVTAVFPENRTVALKSLDDHKPFKSVSWDKLVSE